MRKQANFVSEAFEHRVNICGGIFIYRIYIGIDLLFQLQMVTLFFQIEIYLTTVEIFHIKKHQCAAST